MTHSTAGFIDPGFSGHVTLELANVATLPIKLYPGMKIGQVCYFRLTLAGRQPVRLGEVRLALPGPARPHGVPLARQLPPHGDLTPPCSASGAVWTFWDGVSDQCAPLGDRMRHSTRRLRG